MTRRGMILALTALSTFEDAGDAIAVDVFVVNATFEERAAGVGAVATIGDVVVATSADAELATSVDGVAAVTAVVEAAPAVSGPAVYAPVVYAPAAVAVVVCEADEPAERFVVAAGVELSFVAFVEPFVVVAAARVVVAVAVVAVAAVVVAVVVVAATALVLAEPLPVEFVEVLQAPTMLDSVNHLPLPLMDCVCYLLVPLFYSLRSTWLTRRDL